MSKTYHTIIKHNILLQDIASYYNSIKRKAFARVCKNNYILFKNNQQNKPALITYLNAQDMKEFRSKFGMTGRQIHSLNFELKALINSNVEIRLDILKDKKEFSKKIDKDITTLEKEINKLLNDNLNLLNLKTCAYIKKQSTTYINYLKNTEIKKYNQNINRYKNYKVFIFYPHNYHLPNIIKKQSIDKYLVKHNIDKKQFNIIQQYVKKYIELQKLEKQKNKLDKSIKLIEQDINTGKIRICFGGRKLFKSQSYIHNKDYINNSSIDIYSSHQKWKNDWVKARNSNFYMTGCKNETSGNQTCVAVINKDKDDKVIDFNLRVRIPDKIVKDKGLKDKYLLIQNVNFGKFNDKLLYALNHKLPITYRFVRNVDIGEHNTSSPKIGLWYVHFSIDEEPVPIITDKSLGAIGVDLNYSHVSITEIDSKGQHIQSFDLHFNAETYKLQDIINYAHGKYTKTRKIKNSNNDTVQELTIDLHQFKLAEKINNNKYNKKISSQNLSKYIDKVSSNQMKNILGNVCKVITELSKKTGKPIIIEKLNFTQKKRNLKNITINKAYNNMLSSFAYNKFKEFLTSQCKAKGLELIEINPMYTSLIGQINYAKPLGLSIHQAASFVIARRALLYKDLIGIAEKPLYNKKFEICLNSKVYTLPCIVNSKSKVYNNTVNYLSEWKNISSSYNTFKKDIYKINLIRKKGRLSKSEKPNSQYIINNDIF